MNNEMGAGMSCGADVVARKDVQAALAVKNTYLFEAFDKDGNLKWTEKVDNIVTNVGLDDALDKYLKGSAYTAGFFVGLVDSTPTVAAGDTMASHAGWTEIVAYSEATREALVLGTVASQSVDNSASKASFSINADTTVIGGAFLGTDNTKSGSTGVLYSVAAFDAADKSLDNGDTLNVTVTCTAASA